jgi:hypothetical protein
MEVYYRVEYAGVVTIPDEEWDEQTKEDYGNDLNAFVYVYVQEETGAWSGLKIDNIESNK